MQHTDAIRISLEDYTLSCHKVSVVITDLDNTLFDWFEVWHRSFKAMLDVIVDKSGIPRDDLLSEIKAIHQRHRTSEYAFLIEEIPSLQTKHPGKNLVELYNDAIHAYRSARKATLRRYPSVKATLEALKSQGVLVAGYTESMAFYTGHRVRRLELDGLIDILYSPRDHELPQGLTPDQVRKYPSKHYEFEKTEHRYIPPNEFKPNPRLLLDIIEDIGADPSQVIYIGDNLYKDVRMAQDAGVVDVHANYGTAHTREEYQLLVAVTHWTDEEVLREQELKKQDVSPTLSLNKSFGQILDWFEFVPFGGAPTVRLDQQPFKVFEFGDDVKSRLDIWKTIVGVQKHFNDLELKIRNFAIIALGAVLTGTGFALRANLKIQLGGTDIPFAAFLLVVGTIVWMAFWFMDRHWYHRLLLGSVRHGMEVEKSLETVLPEIRLTESIKKESPTNIFGREVRSHHRLNLFYWTVAGTLVTTIAGLLNPSYVVWTAASVVVLLFVYLFRSTRPYKSND